MKVTVRKNGNESQYNVANIAYGHAYDKIDDRNRSMDNNQKKELKKIDRYYASSQICSCCGYRNKKIKNFINRKRPRIK